MGKESRKLKRARDAEGGSRKSANPVPSIAERAAMANPMTGDAIKAMVLRLGLLLLAVWFVCGTIAAFSQSEISQYVSLGIAALVTVVVVGVAVWGLGRAKKAQGVAGILSGVETDDDRRAAISKLDDKFKANDPAALFAKAQLQMQDDPRAALETLEQISLSKGMATVHDEARAQRGMIHLMLGEVSKARDLADGIDLGRHQDARSKAMMSAVIAEAWARTGQAKKALRTIEVFNPDDDEFVQLRPQLYRSRVYVYAYNNDVKAMRRALRKLAAIDPRMLGGFVVKKAHPLLQKEVRVLLEQSGAVQRKMQFQR